MDFLALAGRLVVPEGGEPSKPLLPLAPVSNLTRNVVASSLAGVLAGGCSERAVDDRSDELMFDSSGVGMVDSEEGVHLFTHAPEAWNQAALTGAPSVDYGALLPESEGDAPRR